LQGSTWLTTYYAIYKGAFEDGCQKLEINVERSVAMKTNWW
jgi:hypothetical protein